MNIRDNIRDSWLVNQFIAHRGLYDDTHPENTLGAFEEAIKNNYAIEFDVRMLADGTLVIFHDESLSRMTGKDGYLCKLNYKDIKDIKVNNSNYSIPTFMEALKLINGQVPILIEIKNSSIKKIGIMEQMICELLKDYKGEFAICSANPYVLSWFKQHKPEFLRGIISSFYKNEKEGRKYVKSWVVRFILRRMLLNKKTKPDFISYHWNNLPNRFVNKYKNLPILAWTVQNKEEYMQVIKHADNIIFEHFKPQI